MNPLNNNVYTANEGTWPGPKEKRALGNGGGGDDMLERIKKLEEKVSSLQIDMAVIKSNYATKEDVKGLQGALEGVRTELHKSIAAQTKWFVASLFIALGAGLTLAKFLF